MDHKLDKTYLKNIFTIFSGTAISQLILILISPLLTKIYGQVNFGIYAQYSALIAICSTFISGRYELAILLPKERKEALTLVVIGSTITLILSTLILIFVLIFEEIFLSYFFNTKKNPFPLFLIPIHVFFIGLYQCLNYWNNRLKKFQLLSKSRILQNTLTGIGQSAFSLVSKKNGLTFGVIFGQIISTVALFYFFIKENKSTILKINKRDIECSLKKYSDFPKFDIITGLLSMGANQLPNLLLPVFFSPHLGGFFYLSQRVLQTPISIISGSVLDVFKEEASKMYVQEGHAREIYNKTFKLLFIVSFVPCIFMFFFIEKAFIMIFGVEWQVSGEYSQILIIPLTLRFIANPLSFIIYIAQKQKINLILISILFISVLLSFFIFKNHFDVIKAISVVYSIYYLLNIIISAYLAKVHLFKS